MNNWFDTNNQFNVDFAIDGHSAISTIPVLAFLVIVDQLMPWVGNGTHTLEAGDMLIIMHS